MSYDQAVSKLAELLPLDEHAFKISKTRRIGDGLAVDLDSTSDRDALFDMMVNSEEIAASCYISKPRMRKTQLQEARFYSTKGKKSENF